MRQLQIIQTLNNLRHIKRTGPNLFAGIDSGSLSSIAEHSFLVACLVLLFADEVEGVDKDKIVSAAIIHDWSESIIGDIPSGSRSWKSYFPKDIRALHKEADTNALNAILEEAGLEFPSLTKDESILLSFCDLLTQLIEVIDLEQKGHKHQWLGKIYEVNITLLRDFSYDFLQSLVEGLDAIRASGMNNNFLTKVTDNK